MSTSGVDTTDSQRCLEIFTYDDIFLKNTAFYSPLDTPDLSTAKLIPFSKNLKLNVTFFHVSRHDGTREGANTH